MVDVYLQIGDVRTMIPGSPFPDLETAHNELRLHANRPGQGHGHPWIWLLKNHDAYGFIIHGTQTVAGTIVIHVPTK